MDFENESSPPSSIGQLISPCTPATPPNPNPRDSSQPSHKRKAGRKKFRETRHPVYRGVRQRSGNKWVCEIREPNKKSRIWVGTYPTPEMAARAHDVAVLALRGTSAEFNFPDSALLLPVPRSCSPRDIRVAAAQATQSFKPNTSASSSSLFDETRCENMDTANLCSCLKISMHGVEGTHDQHNYDESKTTFFDEEALYNMPGLLDSMAEGLLITPPSMERAMDWDDNGYEIIDLTLWKN